MSNFTIVAAVRPNNKLDIRLGTAPKITTITVTINWKQAGWNHACVVVEDDVARVYVDTVCLRPQAAAARKMLNLILGTRERAAAEWQNGFL